MTDIKSNEKIIRLPYLLTETQITVTAPDGTAKSMDRDHSNFDTVLKAVRENRWEDVLREIDVKETINEIDGFEVVDDQVHIDGEVLPSALGTYLLKIIELKMDTNSVVLFWRNLNENTSFRAVQKLFGFLEKNQHPLTEDGCFIAYKGVRADWMDQHSGTIFNGVGETVKISRNQVDEDPNNTCSHGLHVGNHEAAQRYWGNGSGHMLVVKVNPRDVVAIPKDYREAKMRVCEYVVLQETDLCVNDTPVYTPPDPAADDEDEECSGCGASCEENCVCTGDTDDNDDAPYSYS